MTTQLSNIENALVVKVWNKTFTPCENFKHASRIVIAWIEAGGMGASKWCNKSNGNIYDHTGKVVARISYNGRIWVDGKAIWE